MDTRRRIYQLILTEDSVKRGIHDLTCRVCCCHPINSFRHPCQHHSVARQDVVEIADTFLRLTVSLPKLPAAKAVAMKVAIRQAFNMQVDKILHREAPERLTYDI